MNKTLNLVQITNVAQVNLTNEYVAEHGGNRYFGKFINADTGEFSKSTNFIWNGSVFPQGIPFQCLDAVYTVNA